MHIEEMIAAVQKALGIEVDGKAGPETWGAIYERLVKKKIEGQKPAEAIAAVDSRSEKTIATLLPEAQPIARALVQKAAASGIAIKIISGLRTYAAQEALYAQGRTTPGAIVTRARGGYSNHNFGIAFDIGVFEGNKTCRNRRSTRPLAFWAWTWVLNGAGTGRRSSISRIFSCGRPGPPTLPRSRCSPSCDPG